MAVAYNNWMGAVWPVECNTRTMVVWAGANHSGTGAVVASVVIVVLTLIDLHNIESVVIGDAPKTWTGRKPQGTNTTKPKKKQTV